MTIQCLNHFVTQLSNKLFFTPKAEHVDHLASGWSITKAVKTSDMRARTTCTHPKMRQIPNAKPPLAVVNKDVLYIMIDYYLDRCVGNFKGQMSPPYAYFQSQMTALTRRPLKCLCVWFIVSFHNSTLAGSEAYSERGLRGGPFLSSSLLWPHSQTPPTSE